MHNHEGIEKGGDEGHNIAEVGGEDQQRPKELGGTNDWMVDTTGEGRVAHGLLSTGKNSHRELV